jgi:transcriptional antiterminator NusG
LIRHCTGKGGSLHNLATRQIVQNYISNYDHETAPVAEPEDLPWFALRVKSNREKITGLALRGQGYEEFVPTFRRIRPQAGRRKAVDLPLFPGYVFGRFDQGKRLPILMLPGVLHIVGVGKEPRPIDTAEIASIRVIVNSPLSTEPVPFIDAGTRVKVVTGPLTGARGVILQMRDDARLVASLTLLQRSISVQIDPRWVELEEPSANSESRRGGPGLEELRVSGCNGTAAFSEEYR